jgi:hypothetical protein
MLEEVDAMDLPPAAFFYIVSFTAKGWPGYGDAWKTCEPHLAVLLRHMIPRSVVDHGLQCRIRSLAGRNVALITRKEKPHEHSTAEPVSDR